MPGDLHGYLSTYLRSYFIHEPPTIAIGGIFPNAIYMPLYDQNLTLERKGNTPHESTCPVDMASDFATYSRFEEILAARKALCGDKDTLGDPRQAPAVDRMTCDELGGITHPEVMARSECYLHSLDCRAYRENYRRALFRCNTDPESEVEVRTAWPALKVHLLWCDMSIGHCVLGAQIIADEAARYKGRTVVVHRLEKANHFIHWKSLNFSRSSSLARFELGLCALFKAPQVDLIQRRIPRAFDEVIQ
ncbi:hypothetical protein A0H81_11021 [Grifola frondosa]|uniref:Uncharacterized protein n=1 Tax=Grifola frondosa TaxID=5627 RepID=A0A1C7LW00_GRIFR|nr:hypothetical protein A0H81_11021 [Grifola frondosa]